MRCIKLQYKKIGASILILLVISFSVVGCGGSKSSSSSTVTTQTLYDIDGKTVDQLNGSSIYTMISAQPSSKPESNSTGSIPQYSITFTTTAAATSSSVASTISLSVINQSKGQAKVDSIMREKENQILASGVKQFSKAVSLINRSTVPTTVVVGTTPWDSVHIYDMETDQTVTIDTTCEYESTNAYFFIDNRDIDAMSKYLADYGTAFNKIYLNNHTYFGTENDIDNNKKIIVVFSKVLAKTSGLLGYFNADDKFLSTQYADSNEGDIIYITTASSYQGDVVEAAMAHEFQHMIYFDQHYNKGVTATYTWLNEALSQAAEYYNGYDTSSSSHYQWIESFLAGDWEYGLSLTYWSNNNYGYGALFIRYLIDQYGDTAIYNMCSTSKIGIAAVEAATGDDFNTIFNNFTRALVLDGKTSDTRYNFKILDLPSIQTDVRKGLATTYSYEAGVTLTGYLYPYMIFFAGWSGNFGSMTLSGNSTSGISGTVFGE
jgi:hypothetical protein